MHTRSHPPSMNTRYRIKQLLLLCGDIIALCIGVVVAFFLRTPGSATWFDQLREGLPWFFLLILIWVVINYINGLYELGRHKERPILLSRVAQTGLINFVVGIIFFYLLPEKIITPKTILLLSIVSGYGLLTLWRLLFSASVNTKALVSPILFIGDMPEMNELARLIVRMPERGYTLAAWIGAPKHIDKHAFPDTTFYDALKAIRPAVSVHHIDTVVIAKDVKQDQHALRELYELLFWHVNIVTLASLYESITGRIPPYTFSETWFLDHLQHTTHPMYARIRRGIDILFGLPLLLLFFLTYPFVALAIRLESNGPILLKQERVGMSGTTFSIYKFRSMYALAADGSAELSGVQFAEKNDKRITKVGAFLRKSRLDELPQAFNILNGDISIIGPRPERPEIVSELEGRMPYYRVRHLVKPGITGWAQVNQHYTDTLEESLQKLQYDLYYIKNRSMLLDLSILLKTVNVVFRGMGQ